MPSINRLIVSIVLENFRFEKKKKEKSTGLFIICISPYLRPLFMLPHFSFLFFRFVFSCGSSEFVIIMNLKCRKISKQIDLSIVNRIWMEAASYVSATFSPLPYRTEGGDDSENIKWVLQINFCIRTISIYITPLGAWWSLCVHVYMYMHARLRDDWKEKATNKSFS